MDPAGAESAVWFGMAAVPLVTMLIAAVRKFLPAFPARYSGALALVIGVGVGIANVAWGGDATQVLNGPSIMEGVMGGIVVGLAATGIHEGLKTVKVATNQGDGIGGD